MITGQHLLPTRVNVWIFFPYNCSGHTVNFCVFQWCVVFSRAEEGAEGENEGTRSGSSSGHG